MRNRKDYEFIANHPEPSGSPVDRLQHVLDVYGDSAKNDQFAVEATRNIYGDGVVTGLTWGDLRGLLAEIKRLKP